MFEQILIPSISETENSDRRTDDPKIVNSITEVNSQENSVDSTQTDAILSTNSTGKRCDEPKETTSSSTDSMAMNSDDNHIVFRSITINNGSERSGNSVLVYDKVKNIIVRKSVFEVDKRVEAIIERFVLRESVDISLEKSINETNVENVVLTNEQTSQNYIILNKNHQGNPLTPIVTNYQDFNSQVIPLIVIKIFC